MRNTATVLEKKNNRLYVEMMRHEACGSCEHCNSCGAKPMHFWIQSGKEANVGDVLLLEVKPKDYWKNIVLLYVFPLCLFLLGVGIASCLTHEDVWMLAGGLIGLALFFLIARCWVHPRTKEQIEVIDVFTHMEQHRTKEREGACPDQ